uniref:Metallothionein n=1 Tax=Hebeloma mesophaeum TaxID=36063 RepID=U6BG95_9AGAR|nr:metallothionein [Hebeloma mesophaeum]
MQIVQNTLVSRTRTPDCTCGTCECAPTCTCAAPVNQSGCGSSSCTCTSCACKPGECKC